LLVTEITRQETDGSQTSDTLTDKETTTILWLGGHKELTLALALMMVGAVVSTTVTVCVADAELPLASVAVQVTVVVPNG
jgi:hypothetical protein